MEKWKVRPAWLEIEKKKKRIKHMGTTKIGTKRGNSYRKNEDVPRVYGNLMIHIDSHCGLCQLEENKYM